MFCEQGSVEQIISNVTVELLNRTPLGSLNREVSSFQGLQMLYLGLRKVFCLWRCPPFRGVLIEGSHCIIKTVLTGRHSYNYSLAPASCSYICKLHTKQMMLTSSVEGHPIATFVVYFYQGATCTLFSGFMAGVGVHDKAMADIIIIMLDLPP